MSKRVLKIVGVMAVAILAAVFARCSLKHAPPVERLDSNVNVITANVDCATVINKEQGTKIQKGILNVRLIDRTAQPDNKHLVSLSTFACQSMYGARQVATAKGADTAWFNGLPFVLVDTIDGATDQARFERGMPWHEISRQVMVAAGTFSSYSHDQLVWTLAHELGHGVYGHAMLRKPIVPLSLIAILVGLSVAGIIAEGWKWRVTGIVVATIGLFGFIAGSALLSIRHELSADNFGVEAAANSGMGTSGAKNAALSMLHRHINAREDSWFQCAMPNLNVHPATRVRVDYIRGNKLNGD